MKEKIITFVSKNKTAVIVVGALIIILIIWFLNRDDAKADGSAESLAKCLKSKGAKFYGSATCGYCKKQKEMFGSDANELPYIECSNNSQLCADAHITGYPTWIFENGKRQSGAIPLDQLRQLSGC